jgi:hypothetical protein
LLEHHAGLHGFSLILARHANHGAIDNQLASVVAPAITT